MAQMSWEKPIVERSYGSPQYAYDTVTHELATPPTLMLESIIMEKDRSREASSGVEAIRA